MSSCLSDSRARISVRSPSSCSLSAALASVLVSPLAYAEDTAQQVFSSPAAAASALVAAAKADDMKTLSSVLGPRSGSSHFIGRSGRRQQCSRQLREPLSANASARLRRSGSCHSLYRRRQLAVSNSASKEGWWLDFRYRCRQRRAAEQTGRTKRAIHYRRFRRTLPTLRLSMQAKRAMERAPASSRKKFTSDPGKHNGLYWDTAAGQPESPMDQPSRAPPPRATKEIVAEVLSHFTGTTTRS